MAPKSPRLQLSNLVLEKFSKLEQGFGLAYGFVQKQKYVVLGFILSEESPNVSKLLNKSGQNLSLTSELLKCWASFQTSLPAGIHIIGNVCITDKDPFLVSVVEATIPDIIDEDIYTCSETQPPLLLVYTDGTIIASAVDDHMQKEELEYEILPYSELLEQYMLIHLKGQVVINIQKNLETVQEEVQEQLTKVALGVFSFYCKSSGVFLISDEEVAGIDGRKSVENLIVKDEDGKKKKSRSSEMEVVSVELLLKPTQMKEVGEIHELARCAPVVQLKKDDYENFRIPFLVDGLCYAHKESTIEELYKNLQASITRQLLMLNSCLLNELQDKKSASLPVAMHFLSEQNGHYMTNLFPTNSDDAALVEKRKRMHNAFVLGKDRPVFRKGCSVQLKDDLPKNSPLFNPHVGLSPGIKDAEVAIVYGRYAYHHYMQDNFDDNGWGCAYRSLQTLVSWFRLQGYSEKPVPTHRDIQKCLVDIGDKPSSFIGTKQWIGSTEVSFCMETLLGVTCKIMSVNSSDELCSRGDDLLRHFKTQGTPIMIGGGVLAHTILGVAFDADSGDIRFLILDPHYTQGEDLSLIQTKGWCGWKGPDFWTKTAFYNLCMPQRPVCL